MNQETQKLLDVLAGAVTREEMEVVVYAGQEAGSPDSTPPVKLALANEIVRLLNTAEIFLTTTVGLAVLSVGSKQAATFERCARAKLGEITTEFAAAYAATYSEEALRATVDFYSTPAGLPRRPSCIRRHEGRRRSVDRVSHRRSRGFTMTPETQHLLDTIAGTDSAQAGLDNCSLAESHRVAKSVEAWIAAGMPDAKKTKIENPVDAGGVVRTDGVGQLRPNSAVMPRPRSGFGELEAAKREIVELESEVASQAILLEACLPWLRDARDDNEYESSALDNLVVTLEALTVNAEGDSP